MGIQPWPQPSLPPFSPVAGLDQQPVITEHATSAASAHRFGIRSRSPQLDPFCRVNARKGTVLALIALVGLSYHFACRCSFTHARSSLCFFLYYEQEGCLKKVTDLTMIYFILPKQPTSLQASFRIVQLVTRQAPDRKVVGSIPAQTTFFFGFLFLFPKKKL